jgi:PhoD-like phosphatase
LVHLGDETYVDTWDPWLQDTPAHGYTKFAGALRKHYSTTDMLKAYTVMPTRMVGDDHDCGPDNCYAATTYGFARRAISDVAAGTTFAAAAWPSGPPTYDTWVEGDVQFFLLDCRLYRDTPGTKPNYFMGVPYDSQIGATQRDWLKAQLAASTARLKIVFAPRAFKESWVSTEQQELVDWITGFKRGVAQVTGAVVFATGDRHNAAVWKLSATRPVYEMLCGPMANTGFHLTTPLRDWQVAWGYRELFFNTATGGPGRAISNSIGQIDVDTAASGTATLRLFNETAQEYALRFTI